MRGTLEKRGACPRKPPLASQLSLITDFALRLIHIQQKISKGFMTGVQKRTNQSGSPASRLPAGAEEELSGAMSLRLTAPHQSGFHGEAFLWSAPLLHPPPPPTLGAEWIHITIYS